MVKRLTLAVITPLLVALAGCGGASTTDKAESNAVTIYELDYGAKWPLTVNHGLVRCELTNFGGGVVFTDPEGTEYGVNGTAQTHLDLPPIDGIWKDDPVAGTKVSIDPVLEKGLALCESAGEQVETQPEPAPPPELDVSVEDAVDIVGDKQVDTLCDAYAQGLAAGVSEDALYGSFLQGFRQGNLPEGAPSSREIFDEIISRC